MSVVLITGGAGPLGTALARHLRSTGHTVHCCSRRSNGLDGHLAVDLTHEGSVKAVISLIQPTVLVHLAGSLSSDFEQAFTVNVGIAQALLDTLSRERPTVRVLLVGSAAEYGLVQACDNPIREDHVLRPVSVYGLTKSWQTGLGMLYAHRKLDVVVARIFNLWGQGLSTQLFAGRVLEQIDRVLSGQQSRITMGSLTAIRDYISLEQASMQLAAILEHGNSGKVYHVASGKPISMRELLSRALQEYGLDLSIVNEESQFKSSNSFDVPVIFADVTRTLALCQST